MANVLTAGNSSNGGTAISTDTSGTLNIVTGSGSGANAITIDTSQNVAMTASQTVAGNLTVTGSITGGSISTANSLKAWVNFNATGTIAIRASGNVSSISDNGVGRYAVNFTTAMTDINYATVISCSPNASSSPGFSIIAGDAATAYTAPTTSSILIGAMGYNAISGYDPSLVSVAIFR
jgi:hypothetical protein